MCVVTRSTRACRNLPFLRSPNDGECAHAAQSVSTPGRSRARRYSVMLARDAMGRRPSRWPQSVRIAAPRRHDASAGMSQAWCGSQSAASKSSTMPITGMMCRPSGRACPTRGRLQGDEAPSARRRAHQAGARSPGACREGARARVGRATEALACVRRGRSRSATSLRCAPVAGSQRSGMTQPWRRRSRRRRPGP